MANLRRRSARLSRISANQSPARKTPIHNAPLGSLVERDETPDNVQPSIDRVLATPAASRVTNDRLQELENLKTPQTEPRPEQTEMNPKTAHRSTTKAPDSGLKLGFSDIKKDKKYDTPSRSPIRRSVPTVPAFEFQFSSEAQLSQDAQKLMENVREDAARIKVQMMAEKAAQEQKDRDAEKMFGTDRKFARPKGKVGRFSDVHMAQFKKMDSIENHASAFRARPGFAAPNKQSLKRSPSKAGLDDPERPRTAGKRATTRSDRLTPPVIGRPDSTSPFKSIPAAKLPITAGSAKRARQSAFHDVSDSRPTTAGSTARPPSLYSPTRASVARMAQPATPSGKPSMLPRSNSIKSIRSVKEIDQNIVNRISPEVPSVTVPVRSSPVKSEQSLYPILPGSPSDDVSESRFKSRIPTLSGLKSILRGNRKAPKPNLRPSTPKRLNTLDQESVPLKKVDFTPSVKSRHAVKLAVDSPSPAKVRRDTLYKLLSPTIPYDSSAYTISGGEEVDWEDQENELQYPSLPTCNDTDPGTNTFAARSKELSRRESKEFKSIFTTLHPIKTEQVGNLTSINTVVNKTNPEYHASNVMRYPSKTNTTGQVHPSTTTASAQMSFDKISPIHDSNNGKKRQLGPIHDSIRYVDGDDEDAKENRQLSPTVVIPGGWNDSSIDEVEEEGTARGGKRMRVSMNEKKASTPSSPVKKPNAAREIAAKNAKERKGRGVLSLARLNALSRPKQRT